MTDVSAAQKQSLADQVPRDSCPLRRSFVQRPSGSTELTPLTKLLRTQGDSGGKGAGLRITLLLSLIWVCAREPYTTNRVASYWSTLLGRGEDGEDGPRAIRDCLHELADRGLVELSARGSRVEIALNNETSGQGSEPRKYTPPYAGEPYISVPRAFWSSGVAGELSGAGVSMYLAALALSRSDFPHFFITGELFDDRYGISRSSRKRGLAELVKLGVLEVKVTESIDLTTFRKVRRNVYTITDAFTQPAAKSTPGDDDQNSDEKK